MGKMKIANSSGLDRIPMVDPKKSGIERAKTSRSYSNPRQLGHNGAKIQNWTAMNGSDLKNTRKQRVTLRAAENGEASSDGLEEWLDPVKEPKTAKGKPTPSTANNTLTFEEAIMGGRPPVKPKPSSRRAGGHNKPGAGEATYMNKSNTKKTFGNPAAINKTTAKKFPTYPVKRVSRSVRAGLIFPIGHIQCHLRCLIGPRRMSSDAPVYMAGVMEYLAFELLDLAAVVTKNRRGRRITPRYIKLGIEKDQNMYEVLKDVTIPRSGFLECMHKALIKPLPPNKIVNKPKVTTVTVKKEAVNTPKVTTVIVGKEAVNKPTVASVTVRKEDVSKPTVASVTVRKEDVNKPTVATVTVRKEAVNKPAVVTVTVQKETVPESAIASASASTSAAAYGGLTPFRSYVLSRDRLYLNYLDCSSSSSDSSSDADDEETDE